MLAKKILIVGGGPVGLSAGLFLNKASHNLKIIERQLKRNVYSKALLTNTRTLSLLHTVGVDRDILNASNTLEGMRIYFNGKLAYKVVLKDHIIETDSVHGQKAVTLPQSRV